MLGKQRAVNVMPLGLCNADMLLFSTASSLSFKTHHQQHLCGVKRDWFSQQPRYRSISPHCLSCHSLSKRLTEATAPVLGGCLCTVHAFSLLLCGTSDLACLFLANAADHITPGRRPLALSGTGRRRRKGERARGDGEKRRVDWSWL